MQPPFPDILFPVFAAACYAFGVIAIKCASKNKTISGMSLLTMNNLLSGAVFIPQIFFAPALPEISIIWQPLLAGAFCAAGNLATFICAERGEVSLMTPIMGVKILFVLMFSNIMLHAKLPSSIIFAGAMCCAAVFLMGKSKGKPDRQKFRFTVFLALCACASYAACDVLMQKYAPNFSTRSMIALTTVAMPVSVIPFIPKLISELKKSNAETVAFGAISSIMLVGESFLMFISITGKIGAAMSNILFNTRGIIAIALIYALGTKSMKLRELDGNSALRRTLGAIMILTAIFAALYWRQ